MPKKRRALPWPVRQPELAASTTAADGARKSAESRCTVAAKWPGEGLLRGGEGGGPSRHDVHRPTQRRRNCRTGHHSARFAELQLNSTLVNVPHIHVMCSPKDKQRCRRRAAMPQPCCQSLAGRVAPARPRERVCCVGEKSVRKVSPRDKPYLFFSRPSMRCSPCPQADASFIHHAPLAHPSPPPLNTRYACIRHRLHINPSTDPVSGGWAGTNYPAHGTATGRREPARPWIREEDSDGRRRRRRPETATLPVTARRAAAGAASGTRQHHGVRATRAPP